MFLIVLNILCGIVTNQSQAVNETNTNVDKVANTTNTSGNRTEKSNNANLSNLGIRPYDFSGFKYGITSYEVSVPESTETIEVYATAQDAKAKITGTGKKALEKGENAVQIVVTAEDGTKKTYTINIIREIQQEEETSNVIENNEKQTSKEGKGLAELKINNLELAPTFKTNIYEYTVKYIGEDTKLNIETKTTEEDYEVEVIGNHNLEEGENIITLLVTKKDGENIATYQVKVEKSLVDKDAIAKEEIEKKEKMQKAIVGSTIAIVMIVIIVIVIIRRRNRIIEEEFYEEMEYDDEEEMPMALKERAEETEETEDQDFEQEDELEYEEETEDFESMSKDKLKQQFLNSYNSRSRNRF